MVAGVRNTSDEETLENLVIRVSSREEEAERSHRLKIELLPQDSITVGWQELDGWKLHPGDELTVSCDQYKGKVTGDGSRAVIKFNKRPCSALFCDISAFC